MTTSSPPLKPIERWLAEETSDMAWDNLDWVIVPTDPKGNGSVDKASGKKSLQDTNVKAKESRRDSG